jgi:serine/threonine protein kinase
VRGDVKIFDFGLAKEIDPNGRDANGMYKLTGDTGSPRYMAVEIALDQPYNEKVDVYSFCILFWQILALETPFEGYTMSMFTKRVVEGGTRPKCDPKWSNNICDLMTRGWGDAAQRPAMDDVVETLRDEVNRNSGDEPLTGKEFLDISRKSELSLRGFSPDSSGGSHSKSLLSRRALNAMKDG